MAAAFNSMPATSGRTVLHTKAPCRSACAAHTNRGAVITAAKKQRTKQQNKGFGKLSPATDLPPAESAALTTEAAQDVELLQAPTAPSQVQQAAVQPTVQSTAALPEVSRGRVFAACAQVSGVLAAVGLLLRAAAPYISPAVRDGQEESLLALLQWPGGLTPAQLGLSLAAAGAVTAARAVLLQVWPDFKAATDRSNQQALGPLQPVDLLWVAALPGVSEELLFRGALIPAIYPDWRGVLIAGVAFGVLHNSGGRNPAFAAWASAVGCAYGLLFLDTQSVYCPMLAHSVANLASAALWLGTSRKPS